MDARYYDSGIGRFASQDPEFWKMSKLDVLLVDPQSWNSYVYSRNNPLINIDPTGNFSINAFWFLSNSTQVRIGNWANSAYQNNSVARVALDHPYAPAVIGAAPLVAYGAVTVAPSVITGGLASKIALGGIAGALGGTVSQGVGDAINGQRSTPKQYAISAGKGFLVGAGGGAGSLLYVGFGGTLGSVMEDVANNEKISASKAVYEGGLSIATAGIVKGGADMLGIEEIRGSYPQAFSRSFFLGSHAIRNYTEEAAEDIVQGGIEFAGGILTSSKKNERKEK